MKLIYQYSVEVILNTNVVECNSKKDTHFHQKDKIHHNYFNISFF